MGLKKSEVSQLNSLISAIKLVEFDANKYPIIVLRGRKVVDGLEQIKGVTTKKGQANGSVKNTPCYSKVSL